MTIIQDTLRLFGITRCYKGFQHTAYAIQLAVEDEDRLEAVTKEIYMETAFHSTVLGLRWNAISEPPLRGHGKSTVLCWPRYLAIP